MAARNYVEPSFRYKARKPSGEVIHGVLKARDLNDATYRVKGRGLEPVEIKQAILTKPAPPREVAEPQRSGTTMIFLLALLLLVILVLVIDPFDLGIVEQYMQRFLGR